MKINTIFKKEFTSASAGFHAGALTWWQWNRPFHFTFVCSVTWPLNVSEVAGDLVLIQTSLLLLCKSRRSNAN